MIRRCLVVALVAAGPLYAGNSPLTPEQEYRATELVLQLGHRSFRVREQASRELVAFGRAVEPVLRAGLTSPDPETRERCRRLLPQALHHDLEKQVAAFLAGRADHGLPGWDRFRQAAGADDAAKALFVDLQRADPAFLDALERDPASVQERFSGRCMDFANLRTYGGPVTTSPEQVGLLLFAALEPRLGRVPGLAFLSNGLNALSYQPAGKQALVGHPVVRKLLVQYLRQTDGVSSYNNLYLVANLELHEGVEIARDLIRRPNRDIHSKMMAVALLGRIGSREHAADIEPFLADKTAIGGVRFGNGPQINTQARDVALAALVQLTGQSAADYKFPYLKFFGGGGNFQLHISPGMLGFADDESRDAALKKWAQWREKDRATEKK